MSRAAVAALLLLALTACTAHGPSRDAPAAPVSQAASPQPLAAAVDTDTRARFIGRAQSMLGQPYRWGGAAPGGFDCSGLVSYAAASAGLQVPRVAKEQEAFGTRIARSDLQAGDLVFMHLHHKELHVGIALDGGRFIHSPATGGFVRIDSLQAEPYRSAFIEARRIIGPIK